MIGCPDCGQRLPTGQEPLTAGEKARLPLGNQNTNTKWNVIRWRAVKGVAAYYGVADWTAKVDPELTYEENLQLMAHEGTKMRQSGSQQSVKELAAVDSGVER